MNDVSVRERLASSGMYPGLPAEIAYQPVAADTNTPFSLATLVPLVLILMTITGAVYPAIDLTAGERERGTLETLIAAPISRMALLAAKYAAVLTVAVLTAVVNLVAMSVTILSSRLGAELFPGGLSLVLIAEVFALTILFAAFFSAILLALTSFARSFKEAQAYLIPIMLLAIAPGSLESHARSAAQRAAGGDAAFEHRAAVAGPAGGHRGASHDGVGRRFDDRVRGGGHRAGIQGLRQRRAVVCQSWQLVGPVPPTGVASGGPPRQPRRFPVWP